MQFLLVDVLPIALPLFLKMVASESERGFTPVRMPPSLMSCSQCLTRSSGNMRSRHNLIRVQLLHPWRIQLADDCLRRVDCVVQQAITDVFALRPQLIIVDLALKVGSGFDVLAALQPGYEPSPMKVVFTNHGLPEYRERSLQLGATHFFDKSLEARRVVELIRSRAADRGGHESEASPGAGQVL
jgi:CheY-like chemotaxis protein